jgi:hypothetical protein
VAGERGELALAAVVSDDGYVVVRAHYMDWASEDLMFFDTNGDKRLVVMVSAQEYVNDDVVEEPTEQEKLRIERPAPITVLWRDPHVQPSTAGPFWELGSCETFVTFSATRFYSLRTGWGRRMIVDLAAMSLMPDSPDESLLDLIEHEEKKTALEALQLLCQTPQESDPDWNSRRRVASSLVLVIAHELKETVPSLRVLEGRKEGGMSGSSHVLGGGWTQAYNLVQPLARLALRFVGEEPSVGGNYVFHQGSRSSRPGHDERPRAATASPPRAWEVAKNIQPGATPDQVLLAAGSPDCIASRSKKAGKYFVWSEVWDYDGPESTTRLVWSIPEMWRQEDRDKPRELAEVQVIPPAWREPSRLLELIRLW